MTTVAFEWGLRDALHGKRAMGLAVVALAPALLLMLIRFTVEPVRAQDAPGVAGVFLTTILMPWVVGILAIVTGGTVLRRPQEEGTLIYQVTRPIRRFTLGAQRSLAAGLAVVALALLAAAALALTLGQWDLVLDALPGLLSLAFALGTLYGLVLSLHRYALGVAVAHLVAETSLAHLNARINEYTLTWHAWSGMGAAADAAGAEGAIPAVGGTILVPLLIAAAAVLLTGYLYRVRGFSLSVGEG